MSDENMSKMYACMFLVHSIYTILVRINSNIYFGYTLAVIAANKTGLKCNYLLKRPYYCEPVAFCLPRIQEYTGMCLKHKGVVLSSHSYHQSD